MAMVVQHNIQAQLALGELNKNSSQLGKLLEKVSSGQKINSAKDDSASFCISEKMREQIRTLVQDNQNVQNGSSLFKVAEGGIDNIVDELRNLKELAINSANDTNTDIDRATIQKEFTQRMANINDIATTTNYNGKKLLDGTYGDHNFVETKYRWVPGSGGGSSTTGGPDATKIVHSGAVEPTGTATSISAGDYTITSDGVYELAAGYTGTITINAQNVKITQADSSTSLNDVYMVGPSGGNANLWIENLNISNSNDKNFIQFQDDANVLNFKGNNTFKSQLALMNSAVINIGSGLTVEGGADGSGIFNFNGACTHWGAIIGLNSSQSSILTRITVNSGNFNTSVGRVGGALIGSGANMTASISSIAVNGGTFIDTNSTTTGFYGDVIIGGDERVNSITIDNASIIAQHRGSYPAVGSSYDGVCGNITITNSYIYYRGNSGAAVGTGGESARNTTRDITIENCKLDIQTATGAGIGSGANTKVGNILIKNTDLSNVIITGGGEVVGKGVNGSCGTVTIENEDGGGGTEGHWEAYETTVVTRKNPLKIHHGTKANQATNFYIGDLHTKSLGTKSLVDSTGNIMNESDIERYDALSYDFDKQDQWLETLKLASNKNLDEISVTTQKHANVAIRVIDGAIESALREATYVGSYLQRLEYTNANVTTMGENVQSAESTIRDADMAKEMTEYTKYNVLTQSAQAMLAQANQNGSAVLSLLQ